MSDKSRLCVQCGRYIAEDVLSTEDGPIHADGCATYDELVREVARLRRIEEAAIWVINPNGSPYRTQKEAIVALEGVLRAALADQPTEEEKT